MWSTGSRHTSFSSFTSSRLEGPRACRLQWCGSRGLERGLRLQLSGLAAAQQVESFWTRDQTQGPCTGRRVRSRCTTGRVRKHGVLTAGLSGKFLALAFRNVVGLCPHASLCSSFLLVSGGPFIWRLTSVISWTVFLYCPFDLFFFSLWFLSSLSETFNQMVHILELTSNFLLSFLLLILFIPHFVFWAVLGLYLPDNLWKLFKP